jgi:hypothetical protein
MMEEKQEKKLWERTWKVNTSNISGALWTAGFMFTAGYCDLRVDSLGFIEGLVSLLFSYIFWPLVLGIHIRTGGL